MIGDDASLTAYPRESWNTYTDSSRVLMRDCAMKGKEGEEGHIALQGGKDRHGMELKHDMNRIQSQMALKEDGKEEVKNLDYYPETGFLKTVSIGKDEPFKLDNTFSAAERQYDGADRCNLIKTSKAFTDEDGKKIRTESEDTTHFDPNSNDVSTQIHHEVRDEFKPRRSGIKRKRVSEYTNTREIQEKTQTGQALHETNTYQSSMKDEKKKDIPFSIIDDSVSSYFAGEDGMRKAGVKTNRTIQPDDDQVKTRIKHDKSIPTEASMTTTQDANGHIASVRGGVHSMQDDSFRHFVTNSENCIVFKQTQNGKNYYIYVEKQPGKMVLTACFGDLPDEPLNTMAKVKTYEPKFVNMNTNHEALSNKCSSFNFEIN